MSLLSFVLRAGRPAVPLAPKGCELLVGPGLALYSFRNTPHIVLFALCFPLARRQVGGAGAAFATTLAGVMMALARWRQRDLASTHIPTVRP